MRVRYRPEPSTTSRAAAMSGLRRAAAILAVAATLAACGSDDEPATSAAATTLPVATSPSTIDPGPSATAPVVPLTSVEICHRLPTPAVAAALGVEVRTSSPDESATPQCSYLFTSGDGPSSAGDATVAFMRADADLGGRTGVDAFQYVVSLNESIAGADATRVSVPVPTPGDEAVRLTGAALHLGVVRTGSRVLTVIVPADRLGPEAADALIAAVGAAFAGGS